ncbi:MAG: hypothetical protein Ct9H90mP18_04940 [Gammaproteobacteria bacterium]|nr:MAG: hypothetical protein Ct9H90mP18_04940 [Gammaproteobacteria bacterium]
MLVGVEIPEVPGSFKKFCSVIGKRSITEFNYRYSDTLKANVFAGIKLSDGKDEKKNVLKKLKVNGYKVKDFTEMRWLNCILDIWWEVHQTLAIQNLYFDSYSLKSLESY